MNNCRELEHLHARIAHYCQTGCDALCCKKGTVVLRNQHEAQHLLTIDKNNKLKK